MTDGERILRQGSKSFALAARLLPRRTRADVAALYAYLRYADDAVDLVPPSRQLAAVERLQHELDALCDGAPQSSPVLAAFQDVMFARRIPSLYPRELLVGFRMDASGARHVELGDLLHYAYRVAGTVGLMCCHVFEVSDGRALAHAAHLGMAMQLTNVCRDVAEDLERGRVYLPQALLGEALGSVLDAHRGRALPRHLAREIAPALDHLLHVAERYYASADVGMRALPLRIRMAVRAARLVYAAIGVELRRRQLDASAGRAVVPVGRKLDLLARAVGRSLGEQSRRPGRGPGAVVLAARRFEDVVLA